MGTEVPQVPVQKKEPTERAATQKKASVTVSTISDDENENADEDLISDDDDDENADEDFKLETEAAAKKGGRKAAANTKASKPTAAAKKRGAANKQPQTLGQRLVTEMLKPAETNGVSPEKKVRKIRASPFNKKSSSVLGRVAKGDDEATGSEDMSVSPLTIDDTEQVMEVPATRARPQRANRRQTRYVLSDSESEVGTDDSEFDENED